MARTLEIPLASQDCPLHQVAWLGTVLGHSSSHTMVVSD